MRVVAALLIQAVVLFIIAAATGLIGAIPVYFLWNWLMPTFSCKCKGDKD